MAHKASFVISPTTAVVEMDLLTSRLNEITQSLNELKQTMMNNLEETLAIRGLLDACPICELDEG